MSLRRSTDAAGGRIGSCQQRIERECASNSGKQRQQSRLERNHRTRTCPPGISTRSKDRGDGRQGYGPRMIQRYRRSPHLSPYYRWSPGASQPCVPFFLKGSPRPRWRYRRRRRTVGSGPVQGKKAGVRDKGSQGNENRTGIQSLHTGIFPSLGKRAGRENGRSILTPPPKPRKSPR